VARKRGRDVATTPGRHETLPPGSSVVWAPTADPRLIAGRLPPRADSRVALALDLGTSTGVAIGFYDPAAPVAVTTLRHIYLGQLNMQCREFESGAARAVKLRQFLRDMQPDVIFFEQVRYTPPSGVFGSPAAILARAATPIEFFGALKSVVACYADDANIAAIPIDIGTIKRRATGAGNANKAAVIAAANATFGCELDPVEYERLGHDNVADSAWVLVCGLEGYGAGVLPPTNPPDATGVEDDAGPGPGPGTGDA
jgi:hypothetical protein